MTAAAFSALAANRQVPESREQIKLSYAPVVQRAAPTVVNIFTAKKVLRRRGPALFDDPFFQRFFGGDLGQGFGGRTEERVQYALGSGVIVRPDGLIVTNNHVIEGADEIKVVLTDRREFEAEIAGVDDRTDLAVLRIKAKVDDLPTLDLADSDTLQVGDLVLAIGNPFGVGQTVTSGIVSALARTQKGKSDLNFFIQTDAAINPGNSGGALVGLDGRLIGINTAIFSKSGGSLGIGFAVPSNMVRTVVGGLAKGGRVVRPWVGVGGRIVDNDIAQSLGLDRPGGVIIEDIFPGSAAERAGLNRGDIILGIGGHEVRDMTALNFRVTTTPVGDVVPLRIWRAGRAQVLRFEIENPPEHPARDQREVKGNSPFTGAVVVNLSPALADELGINPFARGVMVLQVRRGSPAARAGVRPGDVVKRINGADIGLVRDLVTIFDKSIRRWDVTIERQGRELREVFEG
ncbi:MAG: Do family serine endopeptidase [Rhodospirillaceae bacterium]